MNKEDFDVKGVYTFNIPITTMFMNETLRITNTNLITLKGKFFFLNRLINDEFEPIKYIVLGKGTARPVETDEELGIETCRKICNTKIKPKENTLEISCSFTAGEVTDTCEIGVANDKLLISHDLYETLSVDVIGDTTSTIYLSYNFYISPGSIRNNWIKSTLYTKSYYIYEPNNVIGVLEYNTQSGYIRKNSVTEVNNTKGSYYYDRKSKNLYVRTTNDLSPDNHEMIIQN